MPAYHSKLTDIESLIVGRIPLLPLKTTFKGPAPPCSPDDVDIIDEALDFFKANVLFRNFEVESDADRLLIYITLYISQCINQCLRQGRQGAESNMFTLALQNFSIPGDSGFPLGGLCTAPESRNDTDLIRQYIQQIRQETGKRVVERVYARDNSQPDKWWICFAKKKFLNMEL
eukprot:TRINITY_DN10497_c0_g1_i1.p1 TRINITY_DN10497_c0_g1~~TRINITY_DN10497_c0_g1_i1.p1  ORF type:complete len:174 (-),score=46.62 TRINITY_DN10497_c0_g1_i1:63-584(-)